MSYVNKRKFNWDSIIYVDVLKYWNLESSHFEAKYGVRVSIPQPSVSNTNRSVMGY